MNRLKNKGLILGGICLALMVITVSFFLDSYSIPETVQSISLTSQTLNYSEKEPGSIQVEKSSTWIAKNKTRIIFDIDTVRKINNQNYIDIILVLDVSSSMDGDFLNHVKEDSIDFIENVLSGSNNRIALVTFSNSSQIVSEFTNDKERLIDNIHSLEAIDSTNYYQALVNVDTILRDYQGEGRNCEVLFVTDGYPNKDIPNEVGQYDYLKSQYPNVTINGIQYEMGNEVLNPIKTISDYQFVANMQSLDNVLLDAAIAPIVYEKFVLTDTISDYFDIESISSIHPSVGSVEIKEENGKQVVYWTIENLKSGSKPTLMIDAELKKSYQSEDGYFQTNREESITYKIGDIEETVTSTKTPVLSSYYQVSYEGNFPQGCSVDNIPKSTRKKVYDNVEISDIKLSCTGYQFLGWKIATKDTYQMNEDSFQMPEQDVILRAEWGKLSIAKSMDGEVYLAPPPVIGVNKLTGNSLWKYREDITKVVFQNTIKEPINTIYSWDMSEAQNRSVMGYVVPNDETSTTYTAYVQGEGGVIANSNSSYLFSGLYNLKDIEGLEYFDTSNATNMSSMFRGCTLLTTLDLSSFDISNVTDMSYMFYNCNALSSLDLSSFDKNNVTNMYAMFRDCDSLTILDLSSFGTSNVTDMSYMFSSCNALSSLDLSSFDTSNVTNMSYMFFSCNALSSLDLSSFDTSNATDMSSMFSSCNALSSLDLSSFDTSNVTNMGYMFFDCNALSSLDLSSFDTSNVTNMRYMFSRCNALSSLDLSSFDTSNVTDMSYMFNRCTQLTTALDIKSNNITYEGMFEYASTDSSAKITLNYTAEASDLVDAMIASISFPSHVVKGTLIS